MYLYIWWNLFTLYVPDTLMHLSFRRMKHDMILHRHLLDGVYFNAYTAAE